MASFVTGGKTWRIPVPADTLATPVMGTASTSASTTNTGTAASYPVVKTSPVTHAIRDFIGGMGTLYMLYAGAFVVVMALQIVNAIIPKDYKENMSTEGGLELSPLTEGKFTLTGALLLTLLPLAIYFTMNFIEKKTTFITGKNENRNLAICISTIGIIFIVAMWIITYEGKMFAGGYDILNMTKAWMNDRYGFEPYHLSDLQAVVGGEHIYPQDPNFPAKDVYLKEVNGAYFLFDSAGKELPVKR